jgi:hypothetical protein
LIDQPNFIGHALCSGVQVGGKATYREYGVHGAFMLRKVILSVEKRFWT